MIARIATIAALALAVTASAHAGEVAQRERNQQQRIGQGVSSGQLTAHETGHLERREARINASRRADLAANGGHLTGAEKANLNARENSVSSQIYADKHNDRTQSGVAPQ